MEWSTVLSVAVGAGIALLASIGTTWLQNRYQRGRDDAAARREYARRADEHFRPVLYEVLTAARYASDRCKAMNDDVGNLAPLDQCIDRLESSALTRDVAAAATELRRLAVDYQVGLDLLHLLDQQMPHDGGPLDPQTGAKVVEQGERVTVSRQAMLAAAEATREEVHTVTARLEADQRGDN